MAYTKENAKLDIETHRREKSGRFIFSSLDIKTKEYLLEQYKWMEGTEWAYFYSRCRAQLMRCFLEDKIRLEDFPICPGCKNRFFPYSKKLRSDTERTACNQRCYQDFKIRRKIGEDKFKILQSDEIYDLYECLGNSKLKVSKYLGVDSCVVDRVFKERGYLCTWGMKLDSYLKLQNKDLLINEYHKTGSIVDVACKFNLNYSTVRDALCTELENNFDYFDDTPFRCFDRIWRLRNKDDRLVNLYIISGEYKEVEYVKVGISKNPLDRLMRLKNTSGSKELIYQSREMPSWICAYIEEVVLSQIGIKRIKFNNIFQGHTECFHPAMQNRAIKVIKFFESHPPEDIPDWVIPYM